MSCLRHDLLIFFILLAPLWSCGGNDETSVSRGGLLLTIPADENDGMIDVDKDGVAAGIDCDDHDASRFPGNTDTLDGTDHNCVIDLPSCTLCAGISDSVMTQKYCVTATFLASGSQLDRFVGAEIELRITREAQSLPVTFETRFLYELYPQTSNSSCGHSAYEADFDEAAESIAILPLRQSHTVCDFTAPHFGDQQSTRIITTPGSLQNRLELKQGLMARGLIGTYQYFDLTCDFGD